MLWAILLAAAMLQAAEPSRLYIVSAAFSDQGPIKAYRVFDIEPDGEDTLVRYTLIEWVGDSCRKEIVRSAEARVAHASPADLVKKNNPCLVTSAALRRAQKRYRRARAVLAPVSFGIVAECDSGENVLSLPDLQTLDRKRFEETHPEMRHLWDLALEVATPIFGPADIFQNKTEQEDLLAQRAGAKSVPELASGRFDKGLAAALASKEPPTFRSLLAGYAGPVRPSANQTAELVNEEAYRFAHFVPVEYPTLAIQARVQGKVELQVGVDPATGLVEDVMVVSGNPLFRGPSIKTAKQWRFEPASLESGSVNLTLDFALHCQEIVNP